MSDKFAKSQSKMRKLTLHAEPPQKHYKIYGSNEPSSNFGNLIADMIQISMLMTHISSNICSLRDLGKTGHSENNCRGLTLRHQIGHTSEFDRILYVLPVLQLSIESGACGGSLEFDQCFPQ